MLMQRTLACCLLLLAPAFVVADDEAQPKGDAAANADGGDDGGLADLFGADGKAAKAGGGEAAAGDDGVLTQLMEKMTTLQASVDQMNKMNERVVENMTKIDQLQTDMTALNEKLTALADQVAEQTTTQGQLLETMQDGDTTIIPLTAIMAKSPEFQKQVTDAVHSVIKTEGLFTIDNQTSTTRRVFVNRSEFSVDPGKTLTLKVPVGTVTSQIDGEELKTWMVGAPAYSQSVDIVPATSRTTALRPVTSSQQTVTSAPVIATPVQTYSYPIYSYYGW